MDSFIYIGWYNLSCLLQPYCYLSTNENVIQLTVWETFGVTNYGNGWRKDVIIDKSLECPPTSVTSCRRSSRSPGSRGECCGGGGRGRGRKGAVLDEGGAR